MPAMGSGALASAGASLVRRKSSGLEPLSIRAVSHGAEQPAENTTGRPSAQCQGDAGEPGPPTEANKWGPGRLYWWDEVPPVLQYNKFVRSGYRAGLSRRQCLCSLLQYHNETGNIYSHLLPGLVLLALLASGRLPVWQHARLAFLESVLPSLLCFAGSVTYHTLMAHHWRYHTYLRIDMCGVFLVLICGAGPGISWGLQCYPVLRNAALTAYYGSAVAGMVAGVRARSRFGRAAPMLALLLVRLAALLTRLALRTGSRTAAYHYLAMEATSIIGAVVNVARVPERWLFPRGGPPARSRAPGAFDYWLNSHQLMHFLVVFSMAFKYLGTAADYDFRLEQRVGC